MKQNRAPSFWLSLLRGGLGVYLPYGSVRTRAVFLADLDGDEDLDALIARLWGAEVWWNDGQDRFTAASR